MVDDIVTRLRQDFTTDPIPLHAEAADEIERLRAYQNETAKAWTKLTESQEQEIERLRAALEEIANDTDEAATGLLARAALAHEQSAIRKE